MAFPEALITDFRETNPNIARGLEPGDDVSEPCQPDCLDRRRDRRLDGDARAPAAKARYHRDAEEPGRALGQVVRIYLIQTALLGLCGGLAGILVGVGSAAHLPGADRALLPDAAGNVVRAFVGDPRLAGRHADDAALHAASAAEHSQDEACADSPARHGRNAYRVATEAFRNANRAFAPLS